ncbi:hypothetical protein G6F61_014295 [Rhizopus arrhizus]|nr:hypothetical protein G6F61_014295 [Rhizopus arrhizus]
MAFSAFLALGFTPALCATFLKPTHNDNPNIIYRTFNKYYDKISHTYVGHITSAVRHAPRWMILFVLPAGRGPGLRTGDRAAAAGLDQGPDQRSVRADAWHPGKAGWL